MWKNRRRIVALLGSGAIYIMAAVVGPRFCRTACPYAMLQNVLADRQTLAVAFDPEVEVPSRGRVTGTLLVQGEDGTPGEILITAAGRGFRIVRKAAFP